MYPLVHIVHVTESCDYLTCMPSKGLSNWSVCLSVDKNIENTNNQLKYAVIHSKKGIITMFALFFEGHSTDSAIYDLWELQILFLIIARLLRPSSIRIYGTKHVAY